MQRVTCRRNGLPQKGGVLQLPVIAMAPLQGAVGEDGDGVGHGVYRRCKLRGLHTCLTSTGEVKTCMPLIDHVLGLPLVARLTYGQDPVNPARYRFSVTPMNGPLPSKKCVYVLVDSRDRIQKVGMTDNTKGLKGRLQDYRVPYPSNDATIQLYYQQMTTVLAGETLRAFFTSFSQTQTIEVLSQIEEVEFTAHRSIETLLSIRANIEGHPLWLQSQAH